MGDEPNARSSMVAHNLTKAVDKRSLDCRCVYSFTARFRR